METSHVGLEPGLYIVAGPIGNLGDLTPRGAEILRLADVVAVEDTRVSARLLRHAGSDRPMIPYHDHSADSVRARLVDRMAGESVALLSDAGTPLISDPGYKLVRDARAAGRRITTLPGPSAAIAALTLSGLPTDRFLFMGFLPSKAKARGDALDEVAALRATLVFYESGPRLSDSLSAMAAHLGDREAAVSREISKTFEETATGTLRQLSARYADAPPKGEIVVTVGPPGEAPPPSAEDVDGALLDAMIRLPVSKAAGEVAKKFGLDRRALYDRAMELKA
ncbi:16S rRNA methyltransferase [Sphingobium sp. C100]|jgi:16S rRNA (cytidine1402-2'-O)-methyltransferase|uniref:16S rRNA (cytidine(1402)-2'-O)-methyltransferase n=1 Tax=Sphingobium sp. C100 TaxID=1207055 RepID=UPI0003D5D93C|nr:16S rRNA (cytidine(1402)-2'-O)-methyltransferase [Sphingobium sp. C100]ETI62822.1 16S rRNA methyltransferase [Sphingobium sp. C100]PHQ61581.1 MAG: 16S rRNA (cytidine(1402)-2'-O)-methyltransferase [Sphingobium sp.]